MKLHTRKILDKSFVGMGYLSVILLSTALLILLLPIIINGMKAFVFKGTIEFRKFNYEQFRRGNEIDLKQEITKSALYRKYIYDLIKKFEERIENGDIINSYKYEKSFNEIKENIRLLFGPNPDEETPVLMRDKFGASRWDRVLDIKKDILFSLKWNYNNPEKIGIEVFTPRINEFKGTVLEKLFPYLEKNLKKMMIPKLTFYWRFLFDRSFDSHFFGGIGPEISGTFYLVIWTIVFSVPIGVVSAIYLAEFSKPGRIITLIRISISTLAGVPSIVFGLFGLAFFINKIHISNSKSVIAGALTLAILVLPTIIRASEEAIKTVPITFKEAALSLGAGKLYTIFRVILPAALPGIITGIVISIGRAAGETAPIIFTAAVSVGSPLTFMETLSQPTPALSWNIYNLVTEHESVELIRHVQYGMVFSLVMLVLLLNFTAIILRARISKKLRG